VETFHYRYDANGNQVYREWEKLSPKETASGRVGFVRNVYEENIATLDTREYNGFNQLVSVYRDGMRCMYSYRLDGLRYKKAIRSRDGQSSSATHLWDGQNIVAEIGTTGSVTARYLRGINLIAREQDGSLQYYLFNAHGDVTGRTDSNGTVLKRYRYDAFGSEENPEKLDVNPFRYCGEYFDKETGEIYLRARYYGPRTGRFTAEDIHWNPSNIIYGDNPVKWNERKADSNDPLGLNTHTYIPDINAIRQSSNLYAYCMNDPIKYADSNGKLAFLVVTALAGVIIGAATGAIYSYATTGEVTWQSIAVGAAAGGLIGLGAGSAAGVLLTGSATASTLAVSTGVASLSVAMSSGGLAAGGTFLAQNLRNSSVGYTVLGHNPGYLELAEKLKARVFTIPTEAWNKLTNAQQWKLNQEFLDKSMSMSNEFIFSTNAYSARVGSYLYSEIQYLLSNGYRIVDEGWRMIR
jgi:RHS repeat-associated protein